MLTELRVSNFAIIENLHIQFKDGLNIISGETGAGKSILLKSLALLMGAKSNADMVRTGSTQAVIEGCFLIKNRKDILAHLEEMGIEMEDTNLLVRRVVGHGDKSKVYLNGSLVTLATLRDIVAPMIEVAGHSAPLIEMTGQHESRHLLSKAYHLDVVDEATGAWPLRKSYEARYSELQKVEQELMELEKNSQVAAQRLDFLIYQRDEIAALDLAPGEDQDLEVQVRRLKNASRIVNFIENAEDALYNDDDSAIGRLQKVMQKAQELSSFDPEIAVKAAQLGQAKTLIEETLYEFRQVMKNLETDPSELERCEQRLSDFRKLQKKYGNSLSEILQSLVSIENEIATLQNVDTRIAELKKLQSELLADLSQMATELHKIRSQGASKLSDKINSELSDLNMKGVGFEIVVQKTSGLTATGSTDVEFMVQNSPKDPLRPLAKTASGGELSRILLSLKKVVGAHGYPRTYLFDEVDTGVSGTTAEKVGKKLSSIAKDQQVICVTHLPQVAARGDHHYYIQKAPQNKGVSMEVNELSGKERVQEIARLISGEKITKTSLAHAEQLLRA